MSNNEKNFFAKKILFCLLDGNQDLALEICRRAAEIAQRCNASGSPGDRKMTADEIKKLLDPWVRHASRHTSR